MIVKCKDSGKRWGLAFGREYHAVYLDEKKTFIVIDGKAYLSSKFEIIEEDQPITQFQKVNEILKENPYIAGVGCLDDENNKQIGGTHYGSNDTIQFSRDNFPPEQLEGFFRINVIKYVDRYDRKNGIEDLKKAQHYLQMLIELKS